MNNFSWSKAFWFGIATWAIVFIVGSIAVALGMTIGAGWILGLGLFAAVISYLFALNAKPHTTQQALGYGLVWAAIGIVLDLIISRQLLGNIFGLWQYWAAYALVLLAPWVEYGTQGSVELSEAKTV